MIDPDIDEDNELNCSQFFIQTSYYDFGTLTTLRKYIVILQVYWWLFRIA